MKQQKSFKGVEQGQLYLVPTPIGNLEDMTFRSVKTLQNVDLIASEDTRNTQKLLNHFDVPTKQSSLHEHNMQEKIPFFIDKLKQGLNVAQVSDAGMPSISDPGHELVKAAIEEDIPVIALPGASAGITALIASGISAQPFLFYGFLPRKQGEQKKILVELGKQETTLIFYESPHRVGKTIAHMEDVFGGERQLVLCRELTKIHEEYIRGTIAELRSYTAEHSVKGECCLILEGISELDILSEEEESLTVKEHVSELIRTEAMTSKDAIKEVALRRRIKKQDVYKAYHLDD